MQGAPRHIVVEGPIGVGKTTLARRLATSFGGGVVLEAPEDNPFLERFYRTPRRYALPAQLCFLLERARRVEDLKQTDLFSPVRVADFLLEKDRLFAELTLDADELALYDQLARHLIEDPPQPDPVIYLQAPVKVLRERIAGRGIPYEENLDPHYLKSVAEAYTRFFHRYDAAPLLIVNAAEIDLAHGEADFEALLEQLRTLPRGRHYFNPLPF
jgi:deoxyguanosine kinase